MFRPPSLRIFLDYGGDLAAFSGIEGLAEAVIVTRRLSSCRQNADQAAFYRRCAEQWVDEGRAVPGGPAWLGVDVTQAVVTAFVWAAECYEDSSLAERFEQAIPVELYLENIQWATERQARARP